MLGLADDLVQYNDAAGVTYDRLIELVDHFDWDGAPTDATPDAKWAALIEVWKSGSQQGRSEQIKARFESALETLIADAESRAARADALQLSILAEDGILARLKTARKGFTNEKDRFEKAFGEESDETKRLKSELSDIQKKLKSLQKKEHDEVIVLSSSPVYLMIPIFGPLILAGVDIGVGVDLALTREEITSKTKMIKEYETSIGAHERFISAYSTSRQKFDQMIDGIADLTPKVEVLGKAWRAVAADLKGVRDLLSTQGNEALAGENWFKLVTVLKTAKTGWARIAGQANRFRIFGGTPQKVDNVEELVGGKTDQAA